MVSRKYDQACVANQAMENTAPHSIVFMPRIMAILGPWTLRIVEGITGRRGDMRQREWSQLEDRRSGR